jgi:hypothetical protein
MDNKKYNVVITGKVIDGYDLESVKRNVAEKFKIPDKNIDRMFSGRPFVVKKNVDWNTARKYHGILKSAGAECKMKVLTDGPGDITPPSPGIPKKAPLVKQDTGDTSRKMEIEADNRAEGDDYHSRRMNNQVEASPELHKEYREAGAYIKQSTELPMWAGCLSYAIAGLIILPLAAALLRYHFDMDGTGAYVAAAIFIATPSVWIIKGVFYALAALFE